MTVARLWNDIWDSWLLLDEKARDGIEGLWHGLEQGVLGFTADAARLGLDALVEHAPAERLTTWEKFETPWTVKKGALSIPTLQDRVADPQTIWTEVIDYDLVMDDDTGTQRIQWKVALPRQAVWAPRVERANDRAVKLLSEPLPADLAGWPLAARPAGVESLRALWYAFLHGPTLTNMYSALGAACGLDQARHAGQIVPRDPNDGADVVRVRYGASVGGFSDSEGLVVCGRALFGDVAVEEQRSDRRVVLQDPAAAVKAGDFLVPQTGPMRRVLTAHTPTEVDLDLPFAEAPGTVRGVRPDQDWPYDLWVGSAAQDRFGNRHTIIASAPSTITCTHRLPDGPLLIVPLFMDAAHEKFTLPEYSAPAHAVGAWVRRFEALSDGVSLTEWRSDDRWRLNEERILPLAASATGTKDLTFAAGVTRAVLIGARYRVVAADQPDLLVVVKAIGATTLIGTITLTVDRNVPRAYSLAAMARLVPAHPVVAGLNNWWPVTEGKMGASTPADGLALTNDTGSFADLSIAVGDEVRVVVDGKEHFASVHSIVSANRLTLVSPLPKNLSGAYYHFVRRYTPQAVHRLEASVVPYYTDRYRRAVVQSVFTALAPQSLRLQYNDVELSVLEYVEDQFDRRIRTEDDIIFVEDLVPHEPQEVPVAGPPSEAVAGPAQPSQEALTAGPHPYAWVLSVFFDATFTKGASSGTPPTTLFTRTSGDEVVFNSQNDDAVDDKLYIDRLQVADDQATLEVQRKTGVDDPTSFEDWASEDGQSLSFYFIFGPETEIWEQHVADAQRSLATALVFASPPRGLWAADKVRVVIAPAGAVRLTPSWLPAELSLTVRSGAPAATLQAQAAYP